MQLLLDLVEKVRDGSAAPVLMERFHKAVPEEGRKFLRSLAYTMDPAALPPFRDLFLGEERVVARRSNGSPLTTLNYLPILMSNLRGAEEDLTVLFLSLDKKDYKRRAYMLDCLGRVAADRQDPEVKGVVYEVLREVLMDREELPQLRLASLVYLKRDLGLDDVALLKAALPKEDLPMRTALSDFLYEYF